MKNMSAAQLGKSDGSGLDVPVALTADVWSRSLRIKRGDSFCLSYRAKSETGTPDIDLYLEQTHLDPNEEGNASGTGQGVIGDVANGWVVPTGVAKIADITDEVWHHVVLSPLCLPFLRFLCDGQGANPADCTLELVLTKQEHLN